MCGIAGAYRREGQLNDQDLIAMRDVLAHRGPDDEGLWVAVDRRLGLVHRRLSVVDLSQAGHQPMANDDGTLWLTYNGEIYNFTDLRQELQQMGYTFRSRTDTEVIIRAFEAWGVEAIARLNGMFAFALYDKRQQKLVLARDRFGEKPLYYRLDSDSLLFASELKAFMAYPAFAAELDTDLALQYLVWGNIPSPRTVFKGVRKLPPAHYLIFDLANHRCQETRYWHPVRHIGALSQMGLEEGIGRLEGLLDDAVRRRLVADVPVGAFLSGGIDSSLIAALMVQATSRLKTFTIGFDDAAFDEAPFAKKIAAHLGTDHREYYVSPQEAQDLLLDLPRIYDEPFADSSAIPTYIVSRLSREEVTVVLTGDGGDELFGGYTAYRNFYRTQGLLRLPGVIRRGMAGFVKLFGSGRVRRHIAMLDLEDPWKLYLYINERTITKLNEACGIVMGGDEATIRDSAFVEAFAVMSDHSHVQAAAFTDMSTYMPDDILTKVDRASMAVSLECRIPLLDYRVAEFGLGLSEECKMGSRRADGKRLLRALLAKFVPPALFERPKRGFSVPLASWFRGDLRWLLDEYLDRGRLRREGVFDADVVEGLVREHLAGHRDREAVLWSLVCWQMWREQWGV